MTLGSWCIRWISPICSSRRRSARRRSVRKASTDPELTQHLAASRLPGQFTRSRNRRTARGREPQRPRAWSYLIPERLAGVQEVGIFYAVRRHKVFDRGIQLGGDAGEGVSCLHHVGPALSVRRVLRDRYLGHVVRPGVGGVARAIATRAARDGVVHVVHAGVGEAEVLRRPLREIELSTARVRSPIVDGHLDGAPAVADGQSGAERQRPVGRREAVRVEGLATGGGLPCQLGAVVRGQARLRLRVPVRYDEKGAGQNRDTQQLRESKLHASPSSLRYTSFKSKARAESIGVP